MNSHKTDSPLDRSCREWAWACSWAWSLWLWSSWTCACECPPPETEKRFSISNVLVLEFKFLCHRVSISDNINLNYSFRHCLMYYRYGLCWYSVQNGTPISSFAKFGHTFFQRRTKCRNDYWLYTLKPLKTLWNTGKHQNMILVQPVSCLQ